MRTSDPTKKPTAAFTFQTDQTQPDEELPPSGPKPSLEEFDLPELATLSPLRVVTYTRGSSIGRNLSGYDFGFTSPSLMATLMYKPRELYIPFLQQQLNELDAFKQQGFTTERLEQIIKIATGIDNKSFLNTLSKSLAPGEFEKLYTALNPIRKSQYSTNLVGTYGNLESWRDTASLTQRISSRTKPKILAILLNAQLYYDTKIVPKPDSDDFSVIKGDAEIVKATIGKDQRMHYVLGKDVTNTNRGVASSILIDCIVKDAQRTNSRALTPYLAPGEGLYMMQMIEKLVVDQQMLIRITPEFSAQMQNELAALNINDPSKKELLERWELLKAYAGSMHPNHRSKFNPDIKHIKHPTTGKSIQVYRQGTKAGLKMNMQTFIETMKSDFSQDFYKKLKSTTATPTTPPKPMPAAPGL